ncbi:MAG: phenylalanine--tRNA ligase subunit alpha [Bacteroidales bacterium]|jgi:phenylalanyl-tRNA synthetase alpha chain|nr:phenylalanine--tRNA ligase subunit alpha [Bacteroidales bacterium]MCK9498086.1 phenylalanine--tRNA ligase subunit alpha [Bacteroidales bacterium]MDY0313576.1 phenylalanine--tRNA ligase subunit alpha [Bacteroidales bacterium]NLB86958.1 phenylalanine--tRNA ligase subunit alpha [Bacteroidales bacterium]NLB87029.1 phenylalanine--tRNA ligase subunit alpha [Bacteroidales bacterium]
MIEKINKILSEVQEFNPKDIQEIEVFRIEYLSKKGKISALFDEFRNLDAEQKREVGVKINILKQTATEKLNQLKEQLFVDNTGKVDIDLTRPSEAIKLGARHPLSVVHNQIIEIFTKLGFSVSDGPEIEDDNHNFALLNFPEHHPARDMQDTFFISEDMNVLLRTHTSSVQAHEMTEQKPPIRSLSPGRVYRNEAISARAHCLFHQVEGLYIDKNVSFADLKQTLEIFAKEMFGEHTKIRLRPSYFPFTEPSAEVDVSCSLCGGKGCTVCKYTGWLEILGCGMVDPNVLEASGINSKIWSGFAFGMGIERITMLKYGIKDLRLFFENDIRFLNQFISAI